MGGTTSVPVLIRGRGPSLSGAPFSVPGTLGNPLLQIFSGQSLIANNDDWQQNQQHEIFATGLDPCRPNPGQSSAPPSCTPEAAILVTLPPGAYTVILSGVGGWNWSGVSGGIRTHRWSDHTAEHHWRLYGFNKPGNSLTIHFSGQVTGR